MSFNEPASSNPRSISVIGILFLGLLVLTVVIAGCGSKSNQHQSADLTKYRSMIDLGTTKPAYVQADGTVEQVQQVTPQVVYVKMKVSTLKVIDAPGDSGISAQGTAPRVPAGTQIVFEYANPTVGLKTGQNITVSMMAEKAVEGYRLVGSQVRVK